MSIFGDLNLGGEGVKTQEDRVTDAGGKYISETGKYDVIVKKAYMDISASGALCFNMTVQTEDEKEMSITEYISNAKKEVFYTDKKDGTKKYMPSYVRMKNVDFLLTKKLQETPRTEKKLIKVWNTEAKKEVPTEKDMLVEWVGKPLTILVTKTKEFKQTKNADGVYVDTDEVKTLAVVDFYVDAVTNKTQNEISGNQEPLICTKWLEKHPSDFVRDRTNGKGKAATPSGAPTPAPTADEIFG